jgi:protein-disulfide isomerase
MKNSIKILLIIEIQIILLLVVFGTIETVKLNKKLRNTNKFVYEALTNKRLETLNTIKHNDIVIGKADAPVTIFLYTRFDCSACNSFFIENYKPLKTDFIDKGMVKLVVRYLVHPSKPETLFASKSAYYADQNGFYETYIQKIDSIYPVLDTATVKNIMSELSDNSAEFYEFMNDTSTEQELLRLANEIRATGIRLTPTLFINNQRLIGNPHYKRLKNIIIEVSGSDI